MQISTEITFHGVDHSDAAAAAVARWVVWLEHFHDRITKCSVTISQPHRRQRLGRVFQVGVVLEVPGREIALTHFVHSDVYVAIGDAFRAARRELREQLDLRRRFVKSHALERAGRSMGG